jgi:hypothetical protein
MVSLLVLLAIAVACFLWMRANQQHRERWLKKLDLPGTWIWEDNDGVLELQGLLDQGHYRLRDGDEEERGEWRLEASGLVLEPQAGQPTTHDLRLFAEGKIGLHGPGRERRIYVKKRSNVIPLRRHG